MLALQVELQLEAWCTLMKASKQQLALEEAEGLQLHSGHATACFRSLDNIPLRLQFQVPSSPC